MDRTVQHDTRSPARDAGRLDHDHRDAGDLPRHPPQSARSRQQLLPAVDDPGLSDCHERARRESRPARRHVWSRPHVQPRLRDLHGRLAAADDRLDDGQRRGDIPGHLPPVPGRRRRVPACQLRRDPDRRVPRQSARNGAWYQQHRRRQRHVRGTRARRDPRAHQLASRVPDLGAGRDLRNGLGLHQVARAEPAATGLEGRLARQHHVRAGPGPDHGLDHLRDPPLRAPRDGLDQPARADPRRHRRAVADRVRDRRAARAAADVPAAAAAHPRLYPRLALHVPGVNCPWWPAVHADHLAAGDLAATTRRRLHADAAARGSLHAAPDGRDAHIRAPRSGSSRTATARARSRQAG